MEAVASRSVSATSILMLHGYSGVRNEKRCHLGDGNRGFMLAIRTETWAYQFYRATSVICFSRRSDNDARSHDWASNPGSRLRRRRHAAIAYNGCSIPGILHLRR